MRRDRPRRRWTPERLRRLEGGRIAVWGLGEEGWATVRYLRGLLRSCQITVLTDRPLSEAATRQLAAYEPVSARSGANELRRLERFDLLVRSPGVSLYRPELEAARRADLPVTSATQLWFDRHEGAPVVCVTGTKGKSTTVSLLAHLLRGAGLAARAAGNIGSPPLGLLDLQPPPELWVLELSSYQTADLEAAPSVAVLLNLFPEHLTWHGSEERYYRDKLRLFRFVPAGRAVVDRDDPGTRRFLGSFDRPVLFDHPSGFHQRDGEIWYRGRRRVAAGELRLPGRHNLANACAALTAAALVGVPVDACLPSLSTFKGLPHRLERLGERRGALWVDDSISTIPQSTAAALAAFPDRPITLLLGGHDRGVCYRELADALVARPVEVVVTLPDSGARIASELRAALRRAGDPERPTVLETSGMEEAVAVARSRTPAGGVVLLSPAAASFGRYADYRDRGRVFAEAAGFASGSSG